MKIIEKHGIDEIILTQVLGWKWVSFVGVPIRGTDGYPNKCRVRELLSPKSLKRWKEEFEGGELQDADGTEPLSYAYCSSGGTDCPPRLFILVDD